MTIHRIEKDDRLSAFINAIEDEKRKQDCIQLVNIFEETSGYEGKMWGPKLIGFGKYHYKLNDQIEGDAPLIAFGLKKGKISLYFAPDNSNRDRYLKDLGKHTLGKTCVYINDIEQIDVRVLKQLIRDSMKYLLNQYDNK
ncbi:DUF1801 domain-containing protein [Macrococcoides caseolyticum]|uniref:DUF1801 domain-containing protein n=1 Tax=Macrococcoides caseolyticum TaxID=69966 RepID=UPI001F1B1D53|nr:DUF1801 domain-containing protein [Macrococcus caseolyticus]MCE4956353.1 DUF1801 domain-containing protein [Macrococcus caseolyticus]